MRRDCPGGGKTCITPPPLAEGPVVPATRGTVPRCAPPAQVRRAGTHLVAVVGQPRKHAAVLLVGAQQLHELLRLLQHAGVGVGCAHAATSREEGRQRATHRCSPMFTGAAAVLCPTCASLGFSLSRQSIHTLACSMVSALCRLCLGPPVCWPAAVPAAPWLR